MHLLTLLLMGATLVDDGALEGHTLGNIWHITHSRDGSRVASCNNVEVVIWDAVTRKKIVSIPVEASAGVMTVALSHDGTRVAVPLDKRIAWFDATTGAHLSDIVLPGDGGAQAMRVSPDGATLVASTAGEGGSYLVVGDNVFDIASGKRSQQLARAKSSARLTADFAFGGGLLALAISNTARGIEVFDTRTWKRLHQQKYKADATRVVFSSDGKWFVTGSIDRRLRLHDAATGKLVKEWVAHVGARTDDLGYVIGLAVAPDDQTIISASDDPDSIRIWDAKTFTQLAAAPNSVGRLSAFSLSPDGKTIVVGGSSKRLQVLRVE